MTRDVEREQAEAVIEALSGIQPGMVMLWNSRWTEDRDIYFRVEIVSLRAPGIFTVQSIDPLNNARGPGTRFSVFESELTTVGLLEEEKRFIDYI